MDIKLLSLFADVAQTKSFAETARNLAIDPSSVSRAIKSIEEEVGCRLLQRSTRSLALTPAGERFLAHIEATLENWALAKEQALTDTLSVKGNVNISSSVAFGQICILPLVREFLASHPDIQLTLKFTDTNLDLVKEQIDFAIRLAPTIDTNMVRTRLFSTCYRVCATPRYLKSRAAIKSPEDLSSLDLVTFDLPEFKKQWLFKKRNTVFECPVKSKVSVANALGVEHCILSSIGPGILPNWIADEKIASGELVNLFPDHSVTATSFDTAAWIVYPERTFLPRKTRVAIDFFRERIRSRFPENN